jgi:hypothetical protein
MTTSSFDSRWLNNIQWNIPWELPGFRPVRGILWSYDHTHREIPLGNLGPGTAIHLETS